MWFKMLRQRCLVASPDLKRAGACGCGPASDPLLSGYFAILATCWKEDWFFSINKSYILKFSLLKFNWSLSNWSLPNSSLPTKQNQKETYPDWLSRQISGIRASDPQPPSLNCLGLVVHSLDPPESQIQIQTKIQALWPGFGFWFWTAM